MFAALVDARCKLQNIFLAKARRCDNPVERGFALRQGAGLVSNQRIDLAHRRANASSVPAPSRISGNCLARFSNFWMHGTGENRPFARNCKLRCISLVQVGLWIRTKFGHATNAAKEIILAGMCDAPDWVGTHFHAANGVGERYFHASCRVIGMHVRNVAIAMLMVCFARLKRHSDPLFLSRQATFNV